jgi:hypothetical protein
MEEGRRADDRTSALERRADARTVEQKSRRVNWLLISILMIFAGVTLGVTMIAWDINNRANERAQGLADNRLLLCMIVAALDVRETGDYKYCEQYDWWIRHQTNARETAPERNQILLCYMLRMIKAPHPLCTELDAKARKR